MNRRAFIQTIIGVVPITRMISHHELTQVLGSPPPTDTMPALFIGHGSPTNVLADNAFTRSLSQLGLSLPAPRAILVISAHWLTRGTHVSTSESRRLFMIFTVSPKRCTGKHTHVPAHPGRPWTSSDW